MAIIKRLKNNSGSDKFIVTRTVIDQGYYTLPVKYWTQVLDNEDILEGIDNGSIVVNDGSSDLSVSEGLKLLKKFQDEDVDIVTGDTFDLVFGDQGSLRNEWAEISIAGIKSNETFEVIPFNSKCVSIIYSNNNNNTDLDIELYKNGTSGSDRIFTWELRDAKYAWKTEGLDSVTFTAGDTLSLYVRDRGSNPNNGYIRVTLKTIDNIKTDGKVGS